MAKGSRGVAWRANEDGQTVAQGGEQLPWEFGREVGQGREEDLWGLRVGKAWSSCGEVVGKIYKSCEWCCFTWGK